MNIRRIIIATHHRPATGPDALVKNPARHTARRTKQTISAVLPGLRRLPEGRRVPEAKEEGCWAPAAAVPSVVRFEAVIVGSFAKRSGGSSVTRSQSAVSSSGSASAFSPVRTSMSGLPVRATTKMSRM